MSTSSPQAVKLCFGCRKIKKALKLPEETTLLLLIASATTFNFVNVTLSKNKAARYIQHFKHKIIIRVSTKSHIINAQGLYLKC